MSNNQKIEIIKRDMKLALTYLLAEIEGNDINYITYMSRRIARQGEDIERLIGE